MKKPQFRPRQGAGVSAQAAQVAGEVVYALSDTHGRATAESFLKEARRRQGGPLDKYFFNWDDSKAARAQYLAQARWLMRSFELIEVVEHKASPSPRGAYYVPDGENSGYIPTANIVASEDLKTKMFVQMKREILSWYRRYADFALVAPDLTPRMRVVLDAVSRLLEADGDIREAAE